MGPAMLLFCLIFIYPVSRTAIMSLFSVKSVTSAVSTWSWAGLDNYIKLFHTPLFITSVINIGKIWLYCGIACLGLAIVLAIILTSGLRGQKFFRAIIYMPNVIAAVAVGYMWLLYVYNAKFGLLHSPASFFLIPYAGPHFPFSYSCRAHGKPLAQKSSPAILRTFPKRPAISTAHFLFR